MVAENYHNLLMSGARLRLGCNVWAAISELVFALVLWCKPPNLQTESGGGAAVFTRVYLQSRYQC